MKKQIALLAAATAVGLSSVSAQTLEDLSVSTTFGWESEYIFRGVKLAGQSFQPGIDLAYGDLYVGAWASMETDNRNSESEEIDFYGGYGIAIDETFSVDLGVTVYYYPPLDDNTVEIYGGFAADVISAPSVYVYYDFDLEALTVEGAVGHSIELAESTSLDLGAYLGFQTPDEGDDYLYYGATADLAYAINEFSSASIGARIAANDGDGDNTEFFWWGVSYSAGF